MRNLITAADVKKWAGQQEKIVYIQANTIITPAARDACKDYGVELVEGKTESSPAGGGPCLSAPQPDAGAPRGIDHAFVARVVEEVVAVLGRTRARLPAACETDPCGFKIVHGDRLSWDGGSAKNGTVQVFDGKDSPNLIAGWIALEGVAPPRQVKGSEVHYLVVAYTIDGREYVGRAGDAVFVPAGSEIGLAATGKAKIFFAVSPANWWRCQTDGSR